MFLYGMNVMGEGLEKLSGGRLEQLLGRLCSTTWRGVLLGSVVTALIQSSSAVTVMVIGFVNSGIMRLRQAVGVIMGANLGTTLTSWLLSLSGVESNVGWMQLFKPTTFAPILALVGVILLFRKKHARARTVGTILLGFAILMSGMEQMSGAAKPLADSPAFTGMLTWFANPLLGMLSGAVLTAVIQSSSASVGILQALSASGGFTVHSAVPIVMGQNIGTCVTALISSIGASVAAKRAALVHLYFNVIGSVALLAVFLGVERLGGTWTATAVVARDIALIHTVFNLLSTVLLLPFARWLEKLAVRSVPDGKAPVDRGASAPAAVSAGETSLLDERFFRSPSFALHIGREVFCRMLTLAADNVRGAVDACLERAGADEGHLEANERLIDAYRRDLGRYLLHLSRTSLSGEASEEVGRMLATLDDVARIGDHAMSMQKLSRTADAGERTGWIAGDPLLVTFVRTVGEMAELTRQTWEHGEVGTARRLEDMRRQAELLQDRCREDRIHRLREGMPMPTGEDDNWALGTLLNDGVRIAAHCEHLARHVRRMQESLRRADAHRMYDAQESVGRSTATVSPSGRE